MGIFYRRPLCFFAFLYMISSVLAHFIPTGFGVLKIALAAVAVIALLLSVLIGLIKKNWQPKSFFVAISAFVICASLCLSYLSIDKKQIEAEKYTGDRYAYMTVVSEGKLIEDNSSYSVYEVIVNGVRDESLSIRAMLFCAFDTELYLGDEVYAFCSIYGAGDSGYSILGRPRTDGECLLDVIIYEPNDAVTDSKGRKLAFSELLKCDHSFTLASARIRGFINSQISNAFSDDVAPLARGVLTGDVSEMSAELVRDFKRTGAWHLLSVSGVHITLLLGSVELLLKKLRVSRMARIAAISALSFGLLVITGFAMTAARSVFMLLMTYSFYIMGEEPDSLTSLFGSIAIILIIWPAAANDLGLWMSFAATLGIFTAYQYFSSKIPHIKKDSKFSRIKSFGRALVDSALLSICATAPVLPFLWLKFGETSLVFIIVTMILEPIVPVFLCGIPIVLALSPIPILSEMLAAVVGFFGKLMVWGVGLFSGLDLASVSLRYEFTDPILLVFTVSLAVGLVIKLKRKWISMIAPAVCIVVFAVFVICFNTFGFSQSTFFYADSDNELLCMTDRGGLSIVDISNGSYDTYRNAITEASRVGCTHIDSFVLTHTDSKHTFAVSHILGNYRVKTLYIPSSCDAEKAIELCRAAERCGTDVILYDVGEITELDGEARFLLASGERIIFTLAGDTTVTYAEASAYSEAYRKVALESDTMIFGSHGGMPEKRIDADGINAIISSPKLVLHFKGISKENVSVVGEYPFEKIININ